MQTKKRAKPVKFGKAAKEAEEKQVEAAAPEEVNAPAHHEAHSEPAAEAHEPAHKAAEPEAQAAQNHELVDKLSDVPFETNFGSPSTEAEAPAAPAKAEHHEPKAEENAFSVTSTSPTASEPATPEEPSAPAAPAEPSMDISPVSPSQSIPPIGRASEPIPFNPHETVFNTPPDAGEKKKNPFLYFLIIAFVAFVTGIGFMAGIYYAMPDKNFFATPSLPSLPGLPASEPTATPALAAQPTATPAPEVKLSALTIRVLNGSGIRGEAAKVKTTLEAQGFTVGTVGNADRSDVAKTQITYKKSVSKAAITKLKEVLGKTYALDKETELPASATSESDITITIGKDTAK